MSGKFEVHDDGEKYLRIEHYDVFPQVGDMKIYASGIFPDPELSE